jgi:hypothetical protein
VCPGSLIGTGAEAGSVASAPADRYIVAGLAGNRRGRTDDVMRAEIQKLVEEIKQSVGLLRRHL